MSETPSLSRRAFLRQMAVVPLAAGIHASTLTALEVPQSVKKSDEHPLPVYRCPKVKPFTLDGNLQKSVWKAVPAVRLVSATGKPQRLQATTLRVCWSETHLYAGFRCTDSDIHATFTKRDEALYNEDVAEVFLCPTGDLRHYYELEFSPRNTMFDAKVVNPNLDRSDLQVDTAWDCPGLTSAVLLKGSLDNREKTDLWWSVEIAVPFAGLEVPTPKPGQEWRANFYRIDYTTPVEFSAWSPTLANPANYHLPSRFGHLLFTEEAGK